jgi:hypothetical protein
VFLGGVLNHINYRKDKILIDEEIKYMMDNF